MFLTPVESLRDHALAAEVKRRARELGFDLAGVAPAGQSRYRDYLRSWLDAGSAGSMGWLAGRFDERTDPSVYLPGAASVICVAINYYVELEPVPEDRRRHHGRVARYALAGEDYHDVLKSRLHALADWLREVVPDAQTRACVDTAPVMEKELAARSGVGWVGKNSCLINPHAGSWLLLGEIITTVPLPADEPATDHCGTCTRCIEACPTGAITSPYQLDARRCISYLTIEHREEIAPEYRSGIGDWLYGCDVCQDVCPHNSKAAPSTDPAVQARFPSGGLDVREVLGWTDEDYRAKLKGSAMRRVKLPMLKRNAEVVAANLCGAGTVTP